MAPSRAVGLLLKRQARVDVADNAGKVSPR